MSDLKEDFLNALKEHDEVIVVFNRANGSTREMRCTTRRIPAENLPSGDAGAHPKHLKPVWDLENQGWRMVGLDHILSVSVIGDIE